MPTVKLTYQKDIDREGTDTLEVSDGRAAFLVNQRRAVILDSPVPAKKVTRRRPKRS